MKPGKHQRSKQRCQDIYLKVHDRGVDNLLLCVHTICINHVTETLLLVTSSVSSKQLLSFVNGQDQKREQNHKTNNFGESHNHSPLLTMIEAFARLKNLFICSRTSYFRTVFTLLLLTMFSVSHIYSWQLARLRCFSLSHAQGMFNLDRICKNSQAKIWKPA